MNICFLSGCIKSLQDLHSTHRTTPNNEKIKNAKGNLKLLLGFLGALSQMLN